MNINLDAVDLDGSGGGGRHAEQRLGDIGAAGADKAGDAQNFSCTHLEGDIAEDAVQCQVLHRQDGLAQRHIFLGKHLGDFAADHHADDVVAGHLA
ncbi:hypothetical protein D3C87_1818670 [compost metagenome]